MVLLLRAVVRPGAYRACWGRRRAPRCLVPARVPRRRMGYRANRAEMLLRDSHVRLDLVGEAVVQVARSGRRGAEEPVPILRGTAGRRGLRAESRREVNLQFHGD